MRKIHYTPIAALLLVTLVFALTPGDVASGKSRLQALLSRAGEAADDARFETRTEAQLRQAVELYEQALKIDPDNGEALTMLSLGYFTLAEAYLGGEEKYKSYDRGYEYGLRSLRTNEDFDELYEKKGFAALKDLPGSVTDVEAVFWTGANLGRSSEAKGVLESLNTLPALVELNRRVLELDEDFLGGGAHRALGSISAEVLKRSPLTFFQIHNHGFNWEKSEEHFLRGIELAPECLENYYSYAKYYALNRNEKELAWENLEKVIARPLGEEFPLINSMAKRKTEETLEEVDFNEDG